MVVRHGGVVLPVLLVVRHWGAVLLRGAGHDFLILLEIFFSVCSNGETK